MGDLCGNFGITMFPPQPGLILHTHKYNITAFQLNNNVFPKIYNNVFPIHWDAIFYIFYIWSVQLNDVNHDAIHDVNYDVDHDVIDDVFNETESWQSSIII